MPAGIIYKSVEAERRYDRYGQFRIMARLEGYVVCRRRGSVPLIITEGEWQELSTKPVLASRDEFAGRREHD